MFSKVREDIHVVEVAVDGVQVLQDRKIMESILVNKSPYTKKIPNKRNYQIISHLHTHTHTKGKNSHPEIWCAHMLW